MLCESICHAKVEQRTYLVISSSSCSGVGALRFPRRAEPPPSFHSSTFGVCLGDKRLNQTCQFKGRIILSRERGGSSPELVVPDKSHARRICTFPRPRIVPPDLPSEFGCSSYSLVDRGHWWVRIRDAESLKIFSDSDSGIFSDSDSGSDSRLAGIG